MLLYFPSKPFQISFITFLNFSYLNSSINVPTKSNSHSLQIYLFSKIIPSSPMLLQIQHPIFLSNNTHQPSKQTILPFILPCIYHVIQNSCTLCETKNNLFPALKDPGYFITLNLVGNTSFDSV